MLIAFTGPMRAGKSTAATHLVLSRGWIRLSFAHPVRRDCAQMLSMIEGVPYHLIEEEMRSANAKEKYRGLLQWYGIYRRTIDADHWVKLLRRRAEITLARGFSAAIDDLRFENEARMVRELGGRIIRVEREGIERSTHASEQDWQHLEVDATLVNSDSIDAMHDQMEELLGRWKI